MLLKYNIINFFKKIFWVHRQIILEINSSTTINLKNLSKNNVLWRFAQSEDILHLLNEGDMNINANNYRYFNAISSGKNLMLVGELHNKIIAYVCVVFDKKIFLKRYFTLQQNEGFVLASYTKADFRGRGIGVQALGELRRRLMIVNPSAHLFCHVDCSNKSSLRMFEKAGYVSTTTKLYRVRFMKWDFVFQNGKYKNRFVMDSKISQPEKDFFNGFIH